MPVTTSWTPEFKGAFRRVDELYEYLNWRVPEGAAQAHASWPVFIPRRLAAKLKAVGPESPLARQFLPAAPETEGGIQLTGLRDPIGDQEYLRAPQLIHRYPSRVLFTPTSVCPVHCRYCFRRNELSPSEEIFSAQFEETLAYLRTHTEVRELIFTGGDPLTLSNDRLAAYLDAFATIPHLRDIRFHTRWPVILPERIDEGLLELLDRASRTFRTVTVAVHSNHLQEFDPAVDGALSRLAGLRVQLLSQTVLLRGVNDSCEELLELFDHLISLRVRPYYLHHPDRVSGGMHFYLPLKVGRTIYAGLRGRLPGWALPHYVLDVPGGAGKVTAFNPESLEFSGQVLTRHGGTVELREP